MPDRRPRIATQALLAQVSVILLVLVAGFGLGAALVRGQSEHQHGERALAVARVLADDPVIVDRVATGRDPDGDVQRLAERTRRDTGMLFVVVTDARGVRLSHPDPSRIGQHVSTPPVALSGRESVSQQRGTLGSSAGAKVPLRDPGGRVIGEVSIGVHVRVADVAAAPLVRSVALFCAAALLLGTSAAVLLTLRLKRQTLGLEPVELADLLREQQAVLGGVGEGVLAVDEHDRITAYNSEAARLLDSAPPSGTPLAEAGLPPVLTRVLSGREELRGGVVACGHRLLVVTAQPVRRSDRELGHVLTLRDRTEQDELERELRALRALSDALRAQAHEYTNRLHTLSGLLDTGSPEQARHYLRELAEAPLATEARDGARLGDPYLRGLLAAKTATASEQGVELRLVEDSHLPGRLSRPLEVVSLLGNLLDNAITAAARGQRTPRWVETSLLAGGDVLHLSVTDSGEGVAEVDAERLFERGFTTRPEPEHGGHGLGLALARQLAAQHGGQVRLERAHGPDHGAVFLAHLPGVVEGEPDRPRAGGPRDGDPGTDEAERADSAQDRSGPGDSDPGEAHPSGPEVSGSEVTSREVNGPEVGSPEVGSPEVGSPEVGGSESGATETGDLQPGEAQPGEARPDEPQPGEAPPGQPQPSEPPPGEPQADEAQADEAQAGKARPGDAEQSTSPRGGHERGGPETRGPESENPELRQPQPGDRKPGDRKHSDRKPGDRKPGDREPGDGEHDSWEHRGWGHDHDEAGTRT